MNEGIEMEKWMGYFEEFLGGVEEKTREQKRKKRDKEGASDRKRGNGNGVKRVEGRYSNRNR